MIICGEDQNFCQMRIKIYFKYILYTPVKCLILVYFAPQPRSRLRSTHYHPEIIKKTMLLLSSQKKFQIRHRFKCISTCSRNQCLYYFRKRKTTKNTLNSGLCQQLKLNFIHTHHMRIWVTMSVIVRFGQVRADKGFWLGGS